MTQVVYGQKGYLGSSMSVRAAEAYEQSEMPISRWTKTAIIQAIWSVHPEMCTRFIARRKKTEMISYRLPAEAVKAGMKEEQVCPVAHASQSRVAYFDVFMQGTGKKRHWENVDFEALTEKFDKAAEKGKRAKMQPKARLDAKKNIACER